MTLHEARLKEILRSKCSYCGALPSKRCRTKKGNTSYYPHADRGRMDAEKSKVVVERHGLRWESYNGEVWHHTVDRPPRRYELWTIVNLKGLPTVLVTCTGGPGRQVATFEDALAEAPLMMQHRRLLDALNRRIEKRIVLLETHFGDRLAALETNGLACTPPP